MKCILAILFIIGSAFSQNTTYKDGTECNCDSIEIGYDDHNRLRYEIPYVNGVTHGTAVYYTYDSTNDTISRSETPFVHGTINGIDRIMYYHDSSYTEFYYVNGIVKKAIGYYNTGSVSSELSYINGKVNGMWKWYFQNGKLAGTALYKQGVMIGYKKCTDGRFGKESLDCVN